MSLAIYAAPFDNDAEYRSENLINKKRQIHNKTQKNLSKENFNSDKVKSVIEKIQNIHDKSTLEDDNFNLSDFEPIPPPTSAGVEKTITTENMQNMKHESNNHKDQTLLRVLGETPLPSYDESNLDLNNFISNYSNSKEIEDYYKKMIPNYIKQTENKDYYNNGYSNMNNTNYNGNNNLNDYNTNDILLKKINYMINLLEEQQDEKTNNVTEEVILYSFIGIFIIFVVDSFARVGKYVR